MIGNGLGPQTIPEVKSLIEKRSREVRELAEGVGKDAWKDAAEKAGPYLEKVSSLSLGLVNQLKHDSITRRADARREREVLRIPRRC